MDRIAGLDQLVTPAMLTSTRRSADRRQHHDAPVPARRATSGARATSCSAAAAATSIEGRGADDIIDGDKYLNVRLSVRTDPASRHRDRHAPT